MPRLLPVLALGAVLVAPLGALADGKSACQVDDECPTPGYCDAGTCEKDSFNPFRLRLHNRATHSTFESWGIYFRSTDAQGSTATVPPLFYRFKNDARRSSTEILFPLYLSHRSPSQKLDVVGPIFSFRDDRGWSGGLAPLLFFGHRDGKSHQVLFPLFAHFSDETKGTNTVILGPGYGRSTRDGFDFGLAPLLFAGRHASSGYFSLAGLYTYRGTPHGWTHVLGPLYASSRDDGYDVGLAPLFHFGKSPGGHVRWFLPPLYLHVDQNQPPRSFTMVGPLFRARTEEGNTSGLFPLLWRVERGPRRYDVGLPLFAHTHDDERRTDRLWVGPYLRFRDERKDSTTHVFFPLVVKHDSPDYHVFVQFPFIWRIRDHADSGTAVFPFFLHVRQPDLTANVAFPLVWRFSGKTATTTVVGNIFYRSTRERGDAAVVPLFGYGTGARRSYAWVLPLLFWHNHNDQTGVSRTIEALFLWEHTSTGWTSALFPLYMAWRRGPTARYIGPLFYRTTDDVKHSAFTLLGPLYFGHDEHTSRGGLIPLLFAARHDDHTWNATLLPLFHAASKTDGSRFITLLGGYSTSAKGVKGFVGPIYFRRETDGYSISLIPVFYHGTDRTADTTTSLLLPLFLRYRTPESLLLAFTPLVWHRSTVESSTTVGIPLFLDHHVHYQSRTTALLPFLIRHRDYTDNTSTWVFPLLYFKREPAGTNAVVFPLFWRLVGEKGGTTTAVFPLFWDVRRGSSTTQVLFPLYAHAHRENADHTLVLNCYYRRGHGSDEGAYSVNIIPFFDWGRPHPGDLEWNLFEGLIGYSRIGRTRTLRLFFQLDVALTPVGGKSASATTFFDATGPSGRLSLD